MSLTEPAVASPWLRVKDASTYSKRSPSLILAALRSGELPGSQTKRGGTWVVHRDDLDAWMRGEKADTSAPRVARRRVSA